MEGPFSLREKDRMRGWRKKICFFDPLTPTLSRKGEGANRSAGWRINPAFSRNPKPPALAGGVFTGLKAIPRSKNADI